MDDEAPLDQPKPDLGDQLILEHDIHLGDLVVFVRRKDGRLTLRRLLESEADSFAGEVLRVEPGENPASRKLRVFRHARPKD